MAKTFKHPLTGFIYEVNVDGLVRVTDPATGDYGIFSADAHWYEGEIRDVDLQICGWVGRLPEAKALREAAGK